MNKSFAIFLQWLTYWSAPLIIVPLAIYAIWYAHVALTPFAHVRRIVATEDQLRAALFEAESIQRGFLLTGDQTDLGTYEQSKMNLQVASNLLQGILAMGRERDIGRDIDALVKLKVAEMDETVKAGKRGDFGFAIGVLKTNIGRRYTKQICDDLTLIRGMETGGELAL